MVVTAFLRKIINRRARSQNKSQGHGQNKMATFRKVNMEIKRTSTRGRYLISANYKGKHVEALTTDSEAFDFLEDSSSKEKCLDAKRHCYYKIVEAYNTCK